MPAEEGVPEKIGNHYFLRKNNGTDIYVSTKKKSGYKKAVDGSNDYTNGKKLVYITNGTLYEYRLADGKRKKIRTFPKGSDYCITASWGGIIYFQILRGYWENQGIYLCV